MSKLVVVTTGPATSVQDAGRFGAQRYGLTTSGAMDRVPLAMANSLPETRRLPPPSRLALSVHHSRRATVPYVCRVGSDTSG